MLITGKCHCGNIAYELSWTGNPAAIPARVCGCTFCTKHGGVWTSHPGSRLRIGVRDPARLSRYEFGTRTATFHICGQCGVPAVVTCDIDGRTYAVVNVNTFDNVDAQSLIRSPASFDGEDVDSRLARRKRNWISTVEFEPAAR
jgi:hypothetical protein